MQLPDLRPSLSYDAQVGFGHELLDRILTESSSYLGNRKKLPKPQQLGDCPWISWGPDLSYILLVAVHVAVSLGVKNKS